jgi:5-methylcytosine-specific restriction endonuclease McrA
MRVLHGWGKHRLSIKQTADKCRRAPGVYFVGDRYEGEVYEVELWSLKRLRKKPSSRSRVDEPPSTSHIFGSRTSLAARMVARECSFCGSQDQLRIHHTNPLRNLAKAPSWVTRVRARQRKTVVLCYPCHVALHAGKARQEAVI